MAILNKVTLKEWFAIGLATVIMLAPLAPFAA